MSGQDWDCVINGRRPERRPETANFVAPVRTGPTLSLIGAGDRTILVGLSEAATQHCDCCYRKQIHSYGYHVTSEHLSVGLDTCTGQASRYLHRQRDTVFHYCDTKDTLVFVVRRASQLDNLDPKIPVTVFLLTDSRIQRATKPCLLCLD